MAASARLVEVWRGPLAESVHRGHVAVVDVSGRCLAWAGDPRTVTLWRSAAKPFQALPLVESGALDRFGLGPAELALACGSHTGTEAHLSVLDRLLAAAGAGEQNLVCGPMLAVDRRARQRQAEPTRRHNPCSGKHAALLAVCAHMGWPSRGYQGADHPVQRLVRDRVQEFAGQEPILAVDGCGLPTFGLPLRAMALAYARLATQRGQRIVAAMHRHPDLTSGPGELTPRLLRAGLLTKEGAEGVYCAALPDRGWGVALKIEDGAARARGPALLHVLAALGALPAELAADRCPALRNDLGDVVGELRPVFTLRQPA